MNATMTIEEMNESVFGVRYVSNGEGFIAEDVSAHETYDDPDMETCMDVELPSMLHVKAHYALLTDVEENGEVNGPYTIEHEGKNFQAEVIGGPSGEMVLHVFDDQGNFLFHVETTVQL
jgi:hypothetical protein